MANHLFSIKGAFPAIKDSTAQYLNVAPLITSLGGCWGLFHVFHCFQSPHQRPLWIPSCFGCFRLIIPRYYMVLVDSYSRWLFVWSARFKLLKSFARANDEWHLLTIVIILLYIHLIIWIFILFIIVYLSNYGNPQTSLLRWPHLVFGCRHSGCIWCSHLSIIGPSLQAWLNPVFDPAFWRLGPPGQ